jgi:DNA repair protein RadA
LIIGRFIKNSKIQTSSEINQNQVVGREKGKGEKGKGKRGEKKWEREVVNYIFHCYKTYKWELILGFMVSKKEKEKEDKAPELTDLPGIGPAALAKLENAGVFDMMSLAVMSPASLSDAAGVSTAVARKAILAARDILELGFSDGMEFAKKRSNIIHITTGSKNFDELLGGKGVESRAITEAFGAFGSGKTQLGLCLAVHAQLPKEQGGAEGKSVYIDTEGTFRPGRIKEIADGLGANHEMVLKNILVARAFNSDHQMLLLEKVGDLIKKGEPIKVVIIDSLTAHFRAEFAGRGQLADRQQKLNRYMHDLMKLAETHNLAVYVTNQVMANPAQLFGDPTTAIGGNIVGHASTYRLYLRRAKQGSRVAKLIDSPNLPDGEAVYYVTQHGLRDKA